MNYILTGNKGLIGTYLKKRLDKEGHNCVMQIDKREGFDVTDLMFKEYQLKEPVDTFFHMAAQCRINEAIANPILPHKNNADGALSVLEFCRKHEITRIVAASSSRVLSPERNPYVASKIYLEEMVKAYSDCYGMEHIIVRPSTVYGPLFDETSRLMNNFFVAAHRGENLRVYGDKTKTLDFTFIDDFVGGIMTTMDGNWNNTYNISGEEEVSLSKLARLVIDEVGSDSNVVFMDSEKAQPQQVKVDISGLKRLGYTPKVGIEEGVKRMGQFYRDNPEAWEKYIDKGRRFYDGKY